MKYNKTLALIPALLLAACGGEEQAMKESVKPGSVVFSYPADGQADVSPKTDVVLRFTDAVTMAPDELRERIRLVSSSQSVPFSISMIDGGKSLSLSPDTELDANQSYTVVFDEPLTASGNRTIPIPNAAGDPGIQFRTRGAFSKVAELANTGDQFDVAYRVPASGTGFEPMNFSTFRLAMTQPVHPDWRALGGSIELLDANGETVPSTVLVKGNRISVDPCVVDDPRECGGKDDVLDAGTTYTLRLANLASETRPEGARFSREFQFTPRATGPTVVLQQAAVDSGLASGAGEDTATRSVLNGQIINGVTLNSVLQGVAGPSQQTGDLFAELAYAPAFDADEALPLRIARGSVLTSTSLDVLVGGSVPVLDAASGQLQTTGDIKVTMLSDASGYLSPNPYTNDQNAPRHITLFMDVAMNTENAQPNAALSQNLMGVELRGIALVQNGVLTIDAIGMVEPNLLGQEFTDSTIAFHLQAATDADSVLDAETLRLRDTTSPTLVSWMPGPENAIPDTRQAMQRPGDPVILFFDESIDPDSLSDGLVLDAGGTPLTISDGNLNASVDGTAVVINPTEGLEHGINYTLGITGSLTDHSGNPAMSQNLSFRLPDVSDGTEAPPVSPLALTTYPGYPCVTSGVDLASESHGVCADAVNTSGGDLEYPAGQSPDQLPVTTLPADRPITVVFSQTMDLDTITTNTVVVEKVSDAATPVGAGELVTGRLEKNNQRIRFYPDAPWEENTFYRYTLVSSDTDSCVANVICGENGLPLETNLLVDPVDAGGPPLTIYFKGTQAQKTVFTPLRNLPIRDTNSNYVVDCDTAGGTDCLEPFAHEADGQGGFLPSANAAKLLINENRDPKVLGSGSSQARVGCQTSGDDCPEKKFIYQTYGLNTEVIGSAIDPKSGKEGVQVLLYPTLLATTSIDVYLDDGNGLTDFVLSPNDPQVTGPQILRMRYAKDDPSCEENCARNSLIPGIIVENDQGQPVFRTEADLTLDAPNLELPLGGVLRHNLFNYPFTLELEGPITFFDDGRMQIEQRNVASPEINVLVTTDEELAGLVDFGACLIGLLGFDLSACGDLVNPPADDEDGAVFIPLTIPEDGLYLNFISNPVKEIPVDR